MQSFLSFRFIKTHTFFCHWRITIQMKILNLS